MPETGDHADIDDDRDHSQRGEDAAVLERVADVRHFEEVCAVCWSSNQQQAGLLQSGGDTYRSCTSHQKLLVA